LYFENANNNDSIDSNYNFGVSQCLV
jgi:hypothetical protein